MRRALHIGLFIGTLIGTSACMTIEPAPAALGASHEIVAEHAALA